MVTDSPPPRMPRLRPEQLTKDQRRLYNEMLDGPRTQGRRRFFPMTDADGVLAGPFNAMLASPSVGTALQRLGVVIRYQSDLPDLVRELVILTVAAHLGSDFEWYAHEPLARRSGLSDEIIAAVKDRIRPRLPDPAQQAAHDLTLALLRTEDVPDALFAAAVETLGTQGAFDISTIVGYYWLLAAQLRLFQVGLPDQAGLADQAGLPDALAGGAEDGDTAGELG
jgi:4-carboxymuconolactone decarboxylase